MFTDIAGKPVCLICGANVAVIKKLFNKDGTMRQNIRIT